MRSNKLLNIYLADHLAGALLGQQLVGRCMSANRDEPELGDFLRRLATEIAEDREALEDVMQRVSAAPHRAKMVGAWMAEKGGRLKFNGHLIGYSPLSRLEELEGLSLGIEGKLSLWRSLTQIASSWPELEGVDWQRLIERADRQRAELEGFRQAAARIALQSPE